MFYILNENIALRSWYGIPYAYYERFSAVPHGIDEEEFFTLLKCDGETDIDPSEIRPDYPVHPCGFREAALTPWQEHKICENRCFPSINWMLTGRCNYNCLHCFNASDNAPLQSEFSFEEALNLIREAAECGVAAFMLTGGEPMLHKNFYEIVREIYENGMFVNRINTNGSFISEETLCALEELGCRPLMKISFDGIGFHDTMRGVAGAEGRTVNAIKLCKEHGLRVMVQTNVNRINIASMKDTSDFLNSIGVDTMRIIRTSESPRWEEKGSGNTLSFDEYYDEMLKIMSSYTGSMTLDIWQMLLRENGHTVISAIKTSEFNDVICRGNRRMAAIASDGSLYPCNQLSGWFESRGISLGNVKDTSLRELFTRGEYIDTVCTTVGEIISRNPECTECRYRYLCCGGCRALACTSDNSYLGQDKSKCVFFKNGWYEKALELVSKQ